MTNSTMQRQGGTRSERRWIILGEDGRYVSIGRHSDPTEEEIKAAEQALLSARTAGWLAVLDGNPYSSDALTLIEVRPLACPSARFADAVQLFMHQRNKGDGR